MNTQREWLNILSVNQLLTDTGEWVWVSISGKGLSQAKAYVSSQKYNFIHGRFQFTGNTKHIYRSGYSVSWTDWDPFCCSSASLLLHYFYCICFCHFPGAVRDWMGISLRSMADKPWQSTGKQFYLRARLPKVEKRVRALLGIKGQSGFNI